MGRFKFINQRDSMQCGVASLAMVCRHYGAKVSLSYLAGYLKRYRSHFVRIALSLAVVSGLQLLIPFLMQSIIDRGIKNSKN